ncbi:hypothetical protein BDV29DRAFT_151867 [Aspergillus leporis]|uniref:Uncharacterized protein n=1 Tax=Aspergillus leporis TaxID=41062 RepID=A0A5N5XGK1_9EURO|nr:hypothetical protein BDV29DRAFT_151867 [Aspergillus leporis]
MQAVKDETRWAAGVSFSSPKVSGGVNYANTKSTTDKIGTQTIERSALLTWEARGGDTVLCSNPPAWASTVKDYRLWRVMDQSELQTMRGLIEAIDIGAFGYITNPTTTNQLNSRADHFQIHRILSRMTKIVEADKTDGGPFPYTQELGGRRLEPK